MNYGRGWVVIEQHFHSGKKRLISILPPRKPKKDVALYVEQTYVDRHASVREKLSHKKGSKLLAYQVSENMYDSVMHCGHEPSFVCFYSEKIILNDSLLKFDYKVCVSRDGELAPKYELRTQSLEVEL
jgi:hypothetical protein